MIFENEKFYVYRNGESCFILNKITKDIQKYDSIEYDDAY
jgi:hypothetical protein